MCQEQCGLQCLALGHFHASWELNLQSEVNRSLSVYHIDSLNLCPFKAFPF